MCQHRTQTYLTLTSTHCLLLLPRNVPRNQKQLNNSISKPLYLSGDYTAFPLHHLFVFSSPKTYTVSSENYTWWAQKEERNHVSMIQYLTNKMLLRKLHTIWDAKTQGLRTRWHTHKTLSYCQILRPIFFQRQVMNNNSNKQQMQDLNHFVTHCPR